MQMGNTPEIKMKYTYQDKENVTTQSDDIGQR